MLKTKYGIKSFSDTTAVMSVGKTFAYPEILNIKLVILTSVTDRAANIIVDCSELEYIDSPAVKFLLEIHKIQAQLGFLLVLSNVKPEIQKTIKNLDRAQTLLMFNSNESASKFIDDFGK